MISKIVSKALPYMPQALVWQFSKKYIAGETTEDAAEVCLKLNRQNVEVTTDLLGEQVKKKQQSLDYKEKYLEIIDYFEEKGIRGNYSLKPTMFGLKLDTEFCFENIYEIVEKAARYNNFIRLDMEDSSCTDLEIDLFIQIKKVFPENVSLVFQAYLKRTLNDIQSLTPFSTEKLPLNLRICKGIYIEPDEISYKKHDKINENFISIVEYMFEHNMYPAIATHDPVLIDYFIRYIEKNTIPENAFEFQMLYGVRPDLWELITEKGYKLRIYVPFGRDWFKYCIRRLQENPHITRHVIKALFRK